MVWANNFASLGFLEPSEQKFSTIPWDALVNLNTKTNLLLQSYFYKRYEVNPLVYV